MVACTSYCYCLVQVGKLSSLCVVPPSEAKQSIYRPCRQTAGSVANRLSRVRCKCLSTQEAPSRAPTMDENQRWRQRWHRGSPPHAPVAPPPHPTYDLAEVVQFALAEDAGELGDVTTLSTVPEDLQGKATFLAKADGVIAGLAVADLVFSTVDPCLSVQWTGKDGDHVKSGTTFGTVKGSARSILVAERLALNFMQRMSGIATATAAMTDRIQGTSARILETRKTAPGLRLPDKWAVLIGGGTNHRIGLFDMVMIKDNHVTSAGGVVPAIQHAQDFVRRKHKHIPIEVETRTLDEVRQVLQFLETDKHSLVKRLMLDNMTKLDPSAPGGVDVSMLKEAVKLVNGKVDTEASGNVTIDTVRSIAESGVTYISCGALTHSFQALDISLKIAIL
ncbi:hypothetical protein ABBQ38_006145 [Trebouxia sp. C0009 RCD-2024]